MQTRTNRPAIIPRSITNPSGQAVQVRKALADFKRRLAEVRKQVYNLYFPKLKSSAVVNKKYEFLLDSFTLSQLSNELDFILENLLLEGGEHFLWFNRLYIDPAYRSGLTQEITNLAQQSVIYQAAQKTAASLLMTEQYQRRIGYLRARVFEDMQGFSAEVSKSVALRLSQGLIQGVAPASLAQDIANAVGSQLFRGERIARTEILNALRQARLDESEITQREMNLKTMQMHISALSPTTRESHAMRHGNLYTIAEQREWWAESPNAINCKCSTTSVLVDANGQPFIDTPIKRARAVKSRWSSAV